ncbi:MAG: tetratricopeptide repeat protein [Treponema sp.]|nr:tetratricopeptide repeat protein [Treponema sp.]
MKKIIAVLALICSFSFFAFSSESASMAFVEGCKAYSTGDWGSAKIMLKKAVSYTQNQNADTYYMLISAEINAGDYKGALEDCNYYLDHFKNSIYYPRISYQKGKLLYNLGEYEKAIIALSDFCHQYENNELYPYALFYIGESLYEGYRYNDALEIYDRVVTEFPDFEKVSAAKYKIESISQRSREEKLLYLLKQTGEEYLSAKEDYEKQLRQYNSESVALTRQKLQETQIRNEELEKQIADLQMEIASLKAENEQKEALLSVMNNNQKQNSENQYEESSENDEKQIEDSFSDNYINQNTINDLDTFKEDSDIPNQEPFDETREQIQSMKEKALEIQRILNEQTVNH